MSPKKMTLEFLVDVLAGQGLILPDKAEGVVKLARAQERKLGRQRRRAGEEDNGPPDAVDVIASLSLPIPGKAGQSIDDEAVMRAVAVKTALPYRKIDPVELDLDVVTRTLPRSFALKHLVVPVGINGQKLEVAVCDPFDLMVLEDVRRVTDTPGHSGFVHQGRHQETHQRILRF